MKTKRKLLAPSVLVIAMLGLFNVSWSMEDAPYLERTELNQKNYVAVHVWKSSSEGFGHGAISLVKEGKKTFHIDLYPNLEEGLGNGSYINSGSTVSNGSTINSDGSINSASSLFEYFSPDFKELTDDTYTQLLKSDLSNLPTTIRLYSLDQDKIREFFINNVDRMRYHLTEAWDTLAVMTAYKDAKKATTGFVLSAVKSYKEIQKIPILGEAAPILIGGGGALALNSAAVVIGPAVTAIETASILGGSIAGSTAMASGCSLATTASVATTTMTVITAAPIVATVGVATHAFHAVVNENRREKSHIANMEKQFIDLNCCSCVDFMLFLGGKDNILNQFSLGHTRYALRSSTKYAFEAPLEINTSFSSRLYSFVKPSLDYLENQIVQNEAQIAQNEAQTGFTGWLKRNFVNPIYKVANPVCKAGVGLTFSPVLVTLGAETTIGCAKYASGVASRSVLPGIALSPDELLYRVEALRSYEKSLFPDTESWIDSDTGETFVYLIEDAILREAAENDM
jgi:hypothetical protein